MNESSVSPAAHFQRACLGNPDLGQLQLTPARDMVARWHRLAQRLGGLPGWESLMAELWTAGHLPHLFRLALAPAQFRMLCPLAAHFLKMPWLTDSLGGPFPLSGGTPARDWLLSITAAPWSATAQASRIGDIELVCLPLRGEELAGGVFRVVKPPKEMELSDRGEATITGIVTQP